MYILILSGAGILDVLFNAMVAPSQAFTGVKVAVGRACTITGTIKLSLQPLFVIAFNSTLNVPDVANKLVGFCVALSTDPLLS